MSLATALMANPAVKALMLTSDPGHSETAMPLAVELLPQGYRCSAFDLRGNWTPIRNEPLFAQQDLSAALVWQDLRIDGRVAPLTVVFGSEMPVFDLAITTPTGNIHLVSTPTGSVQRRIGVTL